MSVNYDTYWLGGLQRSYEEDRKLYFLMLRDAIRHKSIDIGMVKIYMKGTAEWTDHINKYH